MGQIVDEIIALLALGVVGVLGFGLVGYGFMGRAHSNAYRQVAHFFDVDPRPRMVAICGRDESGVF